MQPEPAPRNDVAATLDIARRDLLDLGLRNPLLNYRLLRARGVDVIDELPAEVFRLLVREERRMSFLPGEAIGAPPREVDELTLAQPDEKEAISARCTDLRLQTSHPEKQLQSRLLATYHAARTSMEEQGVNILYLALGMLVWHETDDSERAYRAPLILIPAELERTDARDRFHLRYTGEELVENVSLSEKLKQSFGITSFPELPDPDDLRVPEYFGRVEQAVQGQPAWNVEPDTIVLGFFSFAKYLMYRDLDASTWPEARALLEHCVLHPLLTDDGLPTFRSSYSEDRLLDDQMNGRETFHIVDADSSQSLAILDALEASSMVVQGPPGTGKSQTIVNLIAGAVAAGKRVLFVAEKMAALDVVKRRLDRALLGAACLELHSNRTNKRTIIEELRRTALGERSGRPRAQAELALLGDTRERLNQYCKAVNEPIASSGETPCTAYGKLLGAQILLAGHDLPDLSVDAAATWTAEESARRKHLVQQLQDRVSRSGIPGQHAFRGCGLTVLLPTDIAEIRKLAARTAAVCRAFQNAAQELAHALAVESPLTLDQAAAVSRSATRFVNAPDLTGLDVNSSGWLQREREIRGVLDSGKRHRQLHQQFGAIVHPTAWALDVSAARQTVAEWGGRWWKFVSTRWRKANRVLFELCVTVPREQTAQLQLLDAITASSECAARISGARPWISLLFGDGFQELNSDWDLLDTQAVWTIETKKGVRAGDLAPWTLRAADPTADRLPIKAALRELERAQTDFDDAAGAWTTRLQVNLDRFAGVAYLSCPLADLASAWQTQSDRAEELHSLVAFNQIAAECTESGLDPVVNVAGHWSKSGELLVPLFDVARLSALLALAFQERRALATFDGLRHSTTVSDFRRLDLLQMQHNRAILAASHAQSLPTGGAAGEVGVLWREFEKRTRFLPIRSLMLRAGHAIQSIKPVFMMSPLSIANYLPAGALAFDLIIFDEASQVRPVDAFGAIVRGRQIVVVGDSRQLPPTSFFDSLVAAQENEEEDDSNAPSDIESVLGLFRSRRAHERMLRWHYRSRHESLIAVSNHLFYEDRLVVFPSPARDRTSLGLVYRRLQNAPYDRGKTRTNPVEAKTVALAAMEHARAQLAFPKDQRQTLGVVAFSVAQMDAVLNQMEMLRRNDPSCEEYFSGPPHEPFFVKNLENVQGDERDVILISIGYGRTAEGYLAMNFGPLTRAGGERRLNVLISRARQRCEVFTTLSADDIKPPSAGSQGLAALKFFLNYAETGRLDVPAPSQRTPDSDFEEQVQRALAGLGYHVDSQVGSAGFFLDLAVVDPDHAGRYILGIECDGARYHSARSARDRDRLRQAVLEGLGWNIHRIWSTDWFRDPDQELRKVVQAVQIASSGYPPPAPPAAAEPSEPVGSAPGPLFAAPEASRAPSYECAAISLNLASTQMHEVDRRQLAEWFARIVRVESPVHWTEAARRILSSAGVQRMGNRIQQAFEESLRIGVSTRLFQQRGDFLWLSGMAQPPVRDRSQLPASSRRIELIAPEEIRLAMCLVARDSLGIRADELPIAACRLLGFSRFTEDMRAIVEPHREALVEEGRLALEGMNLVYVAE